MIDQWQQDLPVAGSMESCQKRLYREAMALKNESVASTGRPLASMFEAAGGLMKKQAAQPEKKNNLERIHFFGLSQISPFHLQILAGLQAHFDIRIYSLNPSREYWEDIKTPSEKRWIHRQAFAGLALNDEEILAGDLFNQADHPLLSAWGKPGRESVRLLCQLTDYDFQAGFADLPPPETVLGAIASGLLTLDSPEIPSPPLPQDTSLQIMACPGIRREVETVYNSILYNLEKDPRLCMTDIAVMVSDMGRYKPMVDSVFRRRPERIAYNLVDSSARTESLFAQAVLAFIELARGNFSRKQVFHLLRSPCVMQRWNYGEDALKVWIGWADALGIFYGYENPTSRQKEGPGAGQFSWRQGLERLRLSRIMTPPGRSDRLGGRHFDGLVPFADIDTNDGPLVEKFCRLIESLDACLRPFAKKTGSASQWHSLFFNALDQFVEVTDKMHGEETVYRSLVQACDSFLHYDELSALRPGRELTAEALWTFVSAHLEGVSGGRGDYLTGGVTVSALMPMRPIPFKVVYVLGLEEGRFPGRDAVSRLDLRTRKRRIGDITPMERNRYLFLEIMISVGRKLYLSYVSRDLQKDRELAPCSVLCQLQRYVEQQVLDKGSFKIRQIPIAPDSPAYLAPDAVNEWSDVLINGSIAQRLSCYRRHGLWDAFMDQAAPEDRDAAARYAPEFVTPESTEAGSDAEPISLTISQLRRFLLDPVDSTAKARLGIAELVDDAADLAEAEDEPLTSRFPIDYTLRTLPVNAWLAFRAADRKDSSSIALPEMEFEALYADLSRRSKVPAGAFSVQDKARLKQEVLGLGEQLSPLMEQMRSAKQLYPAVIVGTAADANFLTDGDGLRFDPVVLPLEGKGDAPDREVSISGSMPFLWQAADDTWHCLVVTGSKQNSKHADRYDLIPLLPLMVLCMEKNTPWRDADWIHLHLAYRTKVVDRRYRLDTERHRNYLTDLLSDFFDPLPLLWLPFETVFNNNDLRDLIAKETVDDLDRGSFALLLQDAMLEKGELQTELIGPVFPGDLLDRARQRFQIFLNN
jgi:exonuclease V gamma subunit